MKNSKIIFLAAVVIIIVISIFFILSEKSTGFRPWMKRILSKEEKTTAFRPWESIIKKPDSSKNDSVPPKKQPVLSSQTNTEGLVEVTVTPKDLSPPSQSWDFEMILTTHSGSLNQDLAKSAVLVDDKGYQFIPTVWEGDPPGGHHRSGVLKFMPITVKPQFIELELNGGDIDKKIFRWALQ